MNIDDSSASHRLFMLLLLPVMLLGVCFLLTLGGCGDEDPAPIPVILVPDEYATPQAAMDAAEPGEIITVRPGVYTYSEVRNIDGEHYPGGVRAALFMKDGVFIRGLGTEYGGVVLRDTTDAAFTVGAVFDSVGSTTVIDNLAFEDYSVGVLFTGNAGQAQYVRTSDCPVGIHAVRAAAPEVYFSLVVRADLAGILSEDNFDGFFGGNIVRDCTDGLVATGEGVVGFQMNLICRNDVGLRVSNGAAPVAWNNAIRHNRQNGVLLEGGADPIVVQNDIFGNGIEFEVKAYATPLETAIDASTNYWASVDTLEIMSMILDRADDPARGAFVNFKPASPVGRAGLEAEVDSFCGVESPEDDALLMQLLRARIGLAGGRQNGVQPRFAPGSSQP